MADYIWNSSYLVVSLQSESSYIYIYMHYIKLCVYWVKTYVINGKEALTGDWEELNKEKYVCNVM